MSENDFVIASGAKQSAKFQQNFVLFLADI
jgi:hypothetical protein